MRMGFNQDQIRVVVNRYTKKITSQPWPAWSRSSRR